jgi:hypothetical protein
MKRRHFRELSPSAKFWVTVSTQCYIAEASVVRLLRRLMNISDETPMSPPNNFDHHEKVGPLTIAAIEAKWCVIDDQHPEPGLAFGYLNAQWRIFRARAERLQRRYRGDVELFEYLIPNREWRLEDCLKTSEKEVVWPKSVAYCIERKGKASHTFWASGALSSDF